MILVGLGFCWILDGLSVQIVASAGYQKDLGMSSAQVGAMGTVYLVGQIVGALFFGWMSDKYGRRKIFIWTLVLYLVGTAVSGLAASIWFFAIFRFICGLGIGGEYSAVNSAIDEFIPSKYRGRIDIMVNGTYWAGAALGAVANLFFLDPNVLPTNIGWRVAFFIGPVIGLVLIFVRRSIPESPRWLMTHNNIDEAEQIVSDIEVQVTDQAREQKVDATWELPAVDPDKAMAVGPISRVGLGQIAHVLFTKYPRRSLVGATMMITQSFLYNAIFFTYALVLQNFYHTTPSSTQYYFFPFALGNLLGPLLLGRFFDTWGRRQMIFATYFLSGAVLAVSAGLFHAGLLNAATQTVFWCVSFFFASAGASSAYLTVSEVFPLEIRSQVISYFFALAQVFGAIAPLIFGIMIGTGTSRGPLTAGYFLGAGIMILGGIIAVIFGVDAAGKSLEDITEPLSKAEIVVEEEEATGDSTERQSLELAKQEAVVAAEHEVDSEADRAERRR
ncbi:MFS transporter [Gordonia sp. NPDC003425]